MSDFSVTLRLPGNARYSLEYRRLAHVGNCTNVKYVRERQRGGDFLWRLTFQPVASVPA